MAEPTVVRLKELLFDQENRELDALALRIEVQAEAEQVAREDILRRLEAQYAAISEARRDLDHRLAELRARDEEIERAAGDDERFRLRVARVLDASMRDAEKSRHLELSNAMAPMVRRTFRAELRTDETQDALTKTLYPKLGEMVQKYIASAMRDLMDNINRRLESGLSPNRLVLKLRSMVTGRPMAELALADTQKFQIEEIYLIRRGSGELIHHWSHEPAIAAPGAGGNRDTLISGFLTAITAFAEEAFAGDGSSLRALDLDDHRIYLRASPANLVAAKCSGSAGVAVERTLDAGLIELLQQHNQIEATHPQDGGPEARAASASAHQEMLSGVSRAIENEITAAADQVKQERGSLRPLKIAATLVLLPLLGYFGWQAWLGYQTREVQRLVDGVIAADPELSGYPLTARVEHGGGKVWLSGLAPNASVRERLVARLNAGLPAYAVLQETVSLVPSADIGGALEVERMRRAVQGAQTRLNRLTGDLDRAAARATELPAAREAIGTAREAAAVAQGDLAAAASQTAAERNAYVSRVAEAARRISTAAAAIGGPASPPATAGTGSGANLAESVEELALAAERMSTAVGLFELSSSAAAERARALAIAEERNALLQRDLAVLANRIDGIKIPPPAEPMTPRTRLEAFAREHAVFFSNGIEYRDQPSAMRILADLIRLATSVDGIIRVVGYTDEIGGGATPRNQSLSQQRADKVADELVALGFPRKRIVAVGRATALDLAPRGGATSSSRRVEFEVGFKGEEAPLP